MNNVCHDHRSMINFSAVFASRCVRHGNPLPLIFYISFPVPFEILVYVDETNWYENHRNPWKAWSTHIQSPFLGLRVLYGGGSRKPYHPIISPPNLDFSFSQRMEQMDPGFGIENAWVQCSVCSIPTCRPRKSSVSRLKTRPRFMPIPCHASLKLSQCLNWSEHRILNIGH